MPRRKGAASAAHREPPLPKLPQSAILAMQNFLQSEYGSRRTPSTAAPLFVLMVELHRTHQPWPTRSRVARHIGVDSPFGIDCAIRTALERALISEQIDITQRDTQKGDALERHALARRRFIPSDVLIGVVDEIITGPTTRRADLHAQRRALTHAQDRERNRAA